MSAAATPAGVVRASRPPLIPEAEAKAGESVSAPFHAISIPRRTYTGDFWFARQLGSVLWFAIGDVAGKGAASAVWMAMILEELDATIAPGAPPKEPCAVVRRLDALLRDEMPANRFATIVVGRLEDDGSLTVANAGHPPLMIVRATGEIDQLASNGPPVGILPDRCWGARRATLAPGDRLVAYTDGMPEARRLDGTELGIDGTATLAARVRGADPRAAASRLASELTETALVEDDVTLFVAGR